MRVCQICKETAVKDLLDLGPQPICNRFLQDPSEKEQTYSLKISQCDRCGTLQLAVPLSSRELLPPYPWITYSEPEGHLDQLVETICALPGITDKSDFCGISFKDDSTLMRLKKRGFSHVQRLDLREDLNIQEAAAGVETIQEFLTPKRADEIVKKRRRFNVVIARHILEHASDVAQFMQALERLVHPQGYLIFEVPDCSRALETYDYTTIWEEHSVYFTPVTFKTCFGHFGLHLEHYDCVPYPFENSLIGVVRVEKRGTAAVLAEEILEMERHRAGTFAQNLSQQAEKLKGFLSEYRQNNGKIALFGAGHLACSFVNILGIKGLIDFFVDDNPHKRGLFMPGSKLPIYQSSALLKENIKLCLLSLNPLSEEKVVENNQDFLNQGGKFFSIFPASRYAMSVLVAAQKEWKYADQRI